MASMITRQIVVKGRVQGVGFRWAAHRVAEQAKVTDFVRNTADGNVEIVVQGVADNVEMVTAWSRHGPTFANVERADVLDLVSSPEYQEFEIYSLISS